MDGEIVVRDMVVRLQAGSAQEGRVLAERLLAQVADSLAASDRSTTPVHLGGVDVRVGSVTDAVPRLTAALDARSAAS
jgi:hypothetical protein